MAASAGHRLVQTAQRETRPCVLVDPESRGPEAALVVARSTLASGPIGELARVAVRVTIEATPEAKLSESLPGRLAGGVTAGAVDLFVTSPQRKLGPRVRGEADAARQPEPSNRGMTLIARAPEARLVHRSVARDTGAAPRWRLHVASIVAGVALQSLVPTRQAQARMILPETLDDRETALRVAVGAVSTQPAAVGIGVAASTRRVLDSAPPRRIPTMAAVAAHVRVLPAEREARDAVIEALEPHTSPGGLVVAAAALPTESARVGITVARSTVARSPEERASPRVAAIAREPGVTPRERPSGLRVIEPIASTSGPADQVASAPVVLHVAAAAIAAAVLASVQALSRANTGCERAVTREAPSGVHPASGRVALSTLAVSFERRVRPRELPWRQDLCERGCGHRRTQQTSREHIGIELAGSHSESSQRYP